MTSPPTPSAPRYARYRAASLILVHLLFAAHIVHWKLAGRTLAPLELNELMYTLEAGIVTAGFLFMLLVTLSVIIFGRFFCSWGCHILALQDLCSWAMEKLGVRPKMVRTRALLFVPMGATLYMFVWPQIQFVLFDKARPALHTTDDSSGWASFITSDFWRNLPPPGVALLTFAVVGFVFVYFMGHRAFCRYGCPYGAIFAVFDKLSPGKIARVSDCDACALCTAACQSDIRVHEELEQYGQVVDSACMKDLDCVAACPGGAIAFRFQKPSLFRSRAEKPVAPKASMFSMAEEVFFATSFIPLVLVFRGLYGILPFLLSLALAGITAYLMILCVRLLRAESVTFVRSRLKTLGTWRRSGVVFALAAGLWLSFVAHSAVVRVQGWRGARVVLGASSLTDLGALQRGLSSLEFVERYGLLPSPGVTAGLAELQGRRGTLLAEAGRFPEACSAFESAVSLAPDSGMLRFNFGRVLSAVGRLDEAAAQYQVAASLRPEDAETANNFGYVLMQLGQRERAEGEFKRAIALDGGLSHAHFNLGRLRFEAGDSQGAMEHFQRAAQLDPAYAQWLAEFGDSGSE